MILTKAQFEAVSDAMCAANNVNGDVRMRFDVKGPGEYRVVFEVEEGIRVMDVKSFVPTNVERYDTQNDFFAVYDPYPAWGAPV